MKNKQLCKLEVQRLFGLPESPHPPLVAMISRLASHKGFDLVRYVMEDLLQRDLQFVLLGTGEAELEQFFDNMSKKYPQKCRVMLAYNKAIAKTIYAGADIFLMPSKSEPCGLAQMMACRHGPGGPGGRGTVRHHPRLQSRNRNRQRSDLQKLRRL